MTTSALSIRSTECVIEMAATSIDEQKAERMRMRRLLERCTSQRRGIGPSTRTVSAKTSAAYVG